MKRKTAFAAFVATGIATLWALPQGDAAQLPSPTCLSAKKAQAFDLGLAPIFKKLDSMDPTVAGKKTDALITGLNALAQGKYANKPSMLCTISYLDSKIRAYKATLASEDDDAAILGALTSAVGNDSQNSGTSPASPSPQPAPKPNSGPAPSPAPTSQPAPAPAPTAPKPPAPTSCSGFLPSGAGIGNRPFTEFVSGPDTNVTWQYAQSGGRCTWYCLTGYSVNSAKTSCDPRVAGTGLNVVAQDIASGNPIAGVTVEIIGSLGMSTYSVGTYATDGNGRIPENFSDNAPLGNILRISAPGYSLGQANGCSPRKTGGNFYCDGFKMTGTTIYLYLSNDSASSSIGLSSCGNGWETMGTFGCDSQGRQTQTITSCLPPGYDMPIYWNWDKSTNTFSHLTGKSCK